MMMVRMLSEDEIGVWVLYMNFASIVEVTKSGFIKNASIRYFNTQHSNDEVIIASIFLNILFTVATIILTILGAAAFYYWWNNEAVAILLLIFCIQLVVHIAFAHFDYQLTSQLKFGVMMNAYIVRNLLLFVCLAIPFMLSFTITLANVAMFQVVGLIFAVVYIMLKVKPTYVKWVINRQLAKDIANYGKYIFATNVSSMLFRSTDHYMLGIMVSNASVAYYNLAARITNLIDLPSTAAAEVLFPKTVQSRQTSGTREFKRLYEKTVGYTLAIVVPVTLGAYIFADLIVYLIAGESYSESVTVLKVTLLYGLMLPYLKQFGTIMNALDKPKTNFLTILAIFFVNVGSNYVFIQYFGLMGAAYGTLLTYVFGMVLNQLILINEVNVNIFSTFHYMLEAYQEMYKKGRQYLLKYLWKGKIS